MRLIWVFMLCSASAHAATSAGRGHHAALLNALPQASAAAGSRIANLGSDSWYRTSLLDRIWTEIKAVPNFEEEPYLENLIGENPDLALLNTVLEHEVSRANARAVLVRVVADDRAAKGGKAFEAHALAEALQADGSFIFLEDAERKQLGADQQALGERLDKQRFKSLPDSARQLAERLAARLGKDGVVPWRSSSRSRGFEAQSDEFDEDVVAAVEAGAIPGEDKARLRLYHAALADGNQWLVDSLEWHLSFGVSDNSDGFEGPADSTNERLDRFVIDFVGEKKSELHVLDLPTGSVGDLVALIEGDPDFAGVDLLVSKNQEGVVRAFVHGDLKDFERLYVAASDFGQAFTTSKTGGSPKEEKAKTFEVKIRFKGKRLSWVLECEQEKRAELVRYFEESAAVSGSEAAWLASQDKDFTIDLQSNYLGRKSMRAVLEKYGTIREVRS